ncbi:MAG: hypothetical protein L3J66_14220 [Bacteroidales bacterium]|nr:hypothetical protein [Bacteroidales bacterium]
MKRKITLVFFVQLIVIGLTAQKFEMSVSAGANLTLVPDYSNWVLVANDGLVVPGLIQPGNSATPLLHAETTAETTARFGFITDLEIRMKLCSNCRLSLAIGMANLNYKYDNYVDVEGTPNVRLSELDKDFGVTNLLYLNLRPLNFSIDLIKNKFTLQGGATFNFFLKGKSNSTVILYADPFSGGADGEIEKVYFSSTGSANSVLYGAHLLVRFKIIEALDLYVSGQYYFNSIYNSEKSNSPELKAAKPTTIQLGVSYTFWRF